MKLLGKLDNNLLTGIITLTLSLVIFACTSFLVLTPYKDIPFGFLLSGGIVSIVYVASSFLTRLDEGKQSSVGSLISIIVRFVIFVASVILLAFMYYRWDIKLFNIFTFIGVYTFSTLTFVLLFVIRKNRKE